MVDKSGITVERVFDLMDNWRHLPAYQLERRADIFFALFLPEVLRCRLGLDGDVALIPEFPIKQRESNRSSKVDYLAYSRRAKVAYLIELKTDMKSIDLKQLCLLIKTARNCDGAQRMVEGLKCIAGSQSVMRKKEVRGKYFHLLNQLNELCLVDIPGLDCLSDHCREKVDTYRSCVEGMKLRDMPKLEVVYILPTEDIPSRVLDCMESGNVRRLYFRDFSKCIRTQEVVSRFADSLDRWTKPAGLCPP